MEHRPNIQDWELTEVFIRASGPGGQNVNKVETGVQLRFNALASPSLSDAVKARLKRIAGRRMNAQGEIVIEATEHRSQARNRTEARARLNKMIDEAMRPPKFRRKTAPSLAERRRRLESKRQRSVVKAGRRKPGLDEI